MKAIRPICVLMSLLLVACNTGNRRADTHTSAIDETRHAVAGCATCIFDMKNVTGCVLAVKIDGKDYLVDGSGIDDHGDAHQADGLCNIARRAVVTGKIVNDRFVASSFELLP